MIYKTLVVFVLLLIVVSLGTALFHLLHDRSRSTKTVKALTFRIGLSIALFVLLLVAYHLGWITPHGLGQGSFPLPKPKG
jgi:hypothetical protein